ncbi:MAG: hypothetical protein ACE5LG_07035 [Anaerolineae bacterium]
MRPRTEGSDCEFWSLPQGRARPGEEEHRVLRELKREAIEEALELTVERVLGPRWQRREGEGLSPWLCLHCGSRLLSQMRRNGHYRRNLVVGEKESLPLSLGWKEP